MTLRTSEDYIKFNWILKIKFWIGNILALNFVDIEFVSMVLFLILFVSMTFDLRNHFNVLLLSAYKNEDCDLLKWLTGHLQKHKYWSLTFW